MSKRKDKPEWCPLKTSPADVAPVILARWIDNGRGGYAMRISVATADGLTDIRLRIDLTIARTAGAKMDESEDEE